MANFLAPIINDQQENSNGAPLSGGMVEVYLAGSSTAVTTFSDQAGLNPNTWPIVLNTLGVNGQGAVWLGGGFAYKFVIKDSAGVVQRTIDNVAGINDNTGGIDQWVPFQGAPTYVSATSFTVGGDQTPTLQVGRRLKSINTGGTVYSTITASVYGAPNTTVTVANDSGVLDAGLSQVSYGLISSIDSSLPPGRLISIRPLTASGTCTPTAGTKRWVIEGTGGAGAGGGVGASGAGASTAGGGGSAGASCRFQINNPAPTVFTIGAAGVGASGANGGNGGSSTFGTVTAPGGGGGVVGAALAVAGVSGSGGTGSAAPTGTLLTAQAGEIGAPGIVLSSTSALSGAGANSKYGRGGGPFGANSTVATPGGAANGYGAGGGGAVGVANGASVAGGDGTPGLWLVYEYA